jgi:hypothetical protein
MVGLDSEISVSRAVHLQIRRLDRRRLPLAAGDISERSGQRDERMRSKTFINFGERSVVALVAHHIGRDDPPPVAERDSENVLFALPGPGSRSTNNVAPATRPTDDARARRSTEGGS